MTLRTLNYENYGIFLIKGNAGFCPSTVTRIGCWGRLSYELKGALSRYNGACFKNPLYHVYFVYGGFHNFDRVWG